MIIEIKNKIRAIVREYKYTDYEDVAEELLEYLGKESVYYGHFDEVWSEIEANVNHKSVDELFLQQINEWRLMLGKEIRNCNPEIEMDELGDVVQSYINKILFLRPNCVGIACKSVTNIQYAA